MQFWFAQNFRSDFADILRVNKASQGILYWYHNSVKVFDFKGVNAADVLHEKTGAYVAIWQPCLFNVFLDSMVGRNRIFFYAKER